MPIKPANGDGVLQHVETVSNASSALPPSDALLARYAPLAPVAGCPQVFAHQSADVFALWQAWESECGRVCDVPYWAIVWPAAQVLAQYILDNRSLVRDKTVLDCGCGGGATAITAATGGARRSTGCDLDAAAIVVARRNAAANSIPAEFTCQDVIDCCDPQKFNVILVADLFYQKELSLRLLAALTNAHAQGCEVIIADSGRPFLPKENLSEIHSQSAITSFDVEGCASRTVRLFQFR